VDIGRDDDLTAAARWLGTWHSIGWTGGVRVAALDVLRVLARRDRVPMPRLRIRDRCPHDRLSEWTGEYHERGRGLVVIWMRNAAGTLLEADEVLDTIIHEHEHHRVALRGGRHHSRVFHRRIRKQTSAIGTVSPIAQASWFVAETVVQPLIRNWLGLGPRPPR